ncbi:hypothetical protein BDP27DRAFT_1480341, partial [Rhodocollybia butyracea]
MLFRAGENNTALSQVPLTNTAFSPANSDLWVNGLWFTSLAIALSVALFAVLAKQWLRQYMSIITGSPRERAFIRQFRFDGLKKWRVQAFIVKLPILLHLSLILFLAGLVVFLVPLSITMAYTTGAITILVVILYFTATVLPLLTIQCSYRTTFSDILHYAVHRILYQKIMYPFYISACNWVRRLLMGLEPLYLKDLQSYNTPKMTERREACVDVQECQNLELNVLWWLGESTSNPSAKEILFQSLGTFTCKMTEVLSTNEA